ncbi:hypothetical protein [Sphingomonas sp.]|uniref:hypothetical protein n=1 Tax=Sphingomonas sp. TaxID=28214 RepID=UPI00178F1936|nr:hypothetical protein [Sphingomonas sp.]MBA4761921.1 hypothetical protein [Sphingomonas sp.]
MSEELENSLLAAFIRAAIGAAVDWVKKKIKKRSDRRSSDDRDPGDTRGRD